MATHRHAKCALNDELRRQGRSVDGAHAELLKIFAGQAVAAEWQFELRYAAEPTVRRAMYAKWIAIEKYLVSSPFADDLKLARSEQWRSTLRVVTEIGDVELIEWVHCKICSAQRHEGRQWRRTSIRRLAPTFLLLLNNVRQRKRQAHAALDRKHVSFVRQLPQSRSAHTVPTIS